MEVLPLGDGPLRFTPEPRRLVADDLPQLMEELADEDRHGLIFIAGTAQDDLYEPFFMRLKDWAKQVHGLAQVYLLDPAATAKFEDEVGAAFSAPIWSVRTYRPGVAFQNINDARRHRILGTARLASQSDRSLAMMLGDIARQHAATRAPTASQLRLQRRLLRLENERLIDAVAVTPVIDGTFGSVGLAPSQTSAAADSMEQAPSAIVEQKVPTPNHYAPAEAKLLLVRSALSLDDIDEVSLSSAVARLRAGAVDRVALNQLKKRVEDFERALEQSEARRLELNVALQDAQLETEIERLYIDDHEAKIR